MPYKEGRMACLDYQRQRDEWKRQCDLASEAQADALNDAAKARMPSQRDTWKEHDGAVLWWVFPLREPPYAGTPLDDNFPEYVTHWTRIPEPMEPSDEGEP